MAGADRVGQQLGNYRLLRLLGRGGFAEVYLGEHVYLKSYAALKVLHTVLRDEEQAGFLKEAQTLVRLTHPHIVRLFDFAIEHGTPFLVMEYAPNETLRQRHPAGSRLPLDAIIPYVQQVASALHYAHDQQRPVCARHRRVRVALWNAAIFGNPYRNRCAAPQYAASTIARVRTGPCARHRSSRTSSVRERTAKAL